MGRGESPMMLFAKSNLMCSHKSGALRTNMTDFIQKLLGGELTPPIYISDLGGFL